MAVLVRTCSYPQPDHRTAALFVPPASPLGGSSVAMSSNPEWLSSLRAKIGYNGLWNTLFYATGGGAIRQTEYAGSCSQVRLVRCGRKCG